MLGPFLIHPAKEGLDFPQQEGELTFDAGHQNTSVDIYLTPDPPSSFPRPKRFQVELFNATGGARVHPDFGLANVTLVSNVASAAMWAFVGKLHRPLDPATLNQVLRGLIDRTASVLSREELTAVLEALEKVSTLDYRFLTSALWQKIMRSHNCPPPKKNSHF